MTKFITHRPLWVNILTAIILALLLFALFILSLNLLTHHGRARTVPQVVGKSFDEAERILEKEGFEIVIQDSTYIDTLPPMAVIKQIPESDAVVKVNRTVYLTLNSASPPMIPMPNLIDYSFRNAVMNLESAGLKWDSSYKPNYARNAVIDQEFNGQHIAPGTRIRVGSKVHLILGTGVGEAVFNVPDLVGWTYGEAKAKLESSGVQLTVLEARGVSDTLNSYIILQDPKRYNEEGKPVRIRSGQVINVVLGVTKPVNDSIPGN